MNNTPAWFFSLLYWLRAWTAVDITCASECSCDVQIKQQCIFKAVVLIFTFISLYFPISQVKTAGLHLKVVNVLCLSPSSYILYKTVVGGAWVSRWIFECSLDTISLAVDVFSTSRNGKHHIKPAPDGILTLRPPIRERTVPEPTTLEVSKMGRLFCTAEEVCWVRRVSSEMKQLSSYNKTVCKCWMAVCNSTVGVVNEVEGMLLENQCIAFYLPLQMHQVLEQSSALLPKDGILNHFHGNVVLGEDPPASFTCKWSCIALSLSVYLLQSCFTVWSFT